VTTSHSSPALISTGSDSEKSSLLIRLSNDRLKAPQGILLKGDHLCEHRCDTTPNLGHVPMSQRQCQQFEGLPEFTRRSGTRNWDILGQLVRSRAAFIWASANREITNASAIAGPLRRGPERCEDLANISQTKNRAAGWRRARSPFFRDAIATSVSARQSFN
jgi:hypothetical protein